MWRMFVRRLGPERNVECSGCHGCPDILELEDGDFAVIGADITDFAPQLPDGTGCAAGERIVRLPRATLLLAIPHLQPKRVAVAHSIVV
jgi:hypothetical protein